MKKAGKATARDFKDVERKIKNKLRKALNKLNWNKKTDKTSKKYLQAVEDMYTQKARFEQIKKVLESGD